MNCEIAWETLLDDLEGQLPEPEAQRLHAHENARCPVCRARRAWLQEILPRLPEAANLPRERPSRDAFAYALSLARLLQPAPPAPGRLARLVAHLVSGGRSPVAESVRGDDAPGGTRVYETAHHRILLWDDRGDNGDRYLIGQIYATPGQPLLPAQVSLLTPHTADQFALHEGSEFHFPQVAPGTYLLRCRMETVEIFLPGIDVGR